MCAAHAHPPSRALPIGRPIAPTWRGRRLDVGILEGQEQLDWRRPTNAVAAVLGTPGDGTVGFRVRRVGGETGDRSRGCYPRHVVGLPNTGSLPCAWPGHS